MIRRIILMAVTAALGVVAYYLSRFWDFRLWDREGLFGVEALRPQGGLLAHWLRGSDFAPFELMIWVLGVFAALTALQWIFDRISPNKDSHDE